MGITQLTHVRDLCLRLFAIDLFTDKALLYGVATAGQKYYGRTASASQGL